METKSGGNLIIYKLCFHTVYIGFKNTVVIYWKANLYLPVERASKY